MKIICIGQNYVEHIKELNGKVPETPVFFCKPDTAILRNNAPFYIPDFSNEIHHEVELVVKINKVGKNISTKFASRYYDEITVGIDFTARDLQRKARENGLPWEIAKAFDGAAPIGEFMNVNSLPDKKNINFHLLKNDVLVQKGHTSDMLFNIDEIIAYVSTFFTLKIGDLIYTGTPVGVSKVEVGDQLKAYLENKLLLDFEIK